MFSRLLAQSGGPRSGIPILMVIACNGSYLGHLWSPVQGLDHDGSGTITLAEIMEVRRFKVWSLHSMLDQLRQQKRIRCF